MELLINKDKLKVVRFCWEIPDFQLRDKNYSKVFALDNKIELWVLLTILLSRWLIFLSYQRLVDFNTVIDISNHHFFHKELNFRFEKFPKNKLVSIECNAVPGKLKCFFDYAPIRQSIQLPYMKYPFINKRNFRDCLRKGTLNLRFEVRKKFQHPATGSLKLFSS